MTSFLFSGLLFISLLYLSSTFDSVVYPFLSLMAFNYEMCQAPELTGTVHSALKMRDGQEHIVPTWEHSPRLILKPLQTQRICGYASLLQSRSNPLFSP